MKRARDLAPPVVDAVRSYGRLVINALEDVGAPEADIEASKARMREWGRTVLMYENDIVEVIGNPALTTEVKEQLVAEMLKQRNAKRKEMFE